MSEETIRQVYTASPTAARFHNSRAFFRGLMGPIGSGKSVTCALEVFRRAKEQAPNASGVRKTRFAIVRQTYPELKSTTIKTWCEWMPPDICSIVYSAPITGRLTAILPEDGTRIESEIFFLALENARDVKKLLSLELTGAWLNEAREIPKAIIDAVTSRVGRYPPRKEVPITWSGVIADTNPPDDDHWWYYYAEESQWRTAWGAITRDELREIMEVTNDQETEKLILDAIAGMDEGRSENDWEFFRQPPALLLRDGKYLPNPAAENAKHQPLGYLYWLRQLAGKSREWIKVYCLGEYGSVYDGRPVYDSVWSDSRHVSAKPLEPLPGIPLVAGFDFGLTPAFILGQLAPSGQLRIYRELVCERGGIRQFVTDAVLPMLMNEFRGFAVLAGADPAGTQGSQVNLETCIQECNRLGIPTKAAYSNRFETRRQAVMSYLSRLAGDEPAFQLDPSCKLLRKGFNGAYRFERVAVAGDERFKDQPAKNFVSHPHDGLQYLAMLVDRHGEIGAAKQSSTQTRPKIEQRAW